MVRSAAWRPDSSASGQMRCRDASSTLSSLLANAGLAEDSLEPWATWKIFKAFIRTPLDDVVDDALVQYGVYEDEDGVARAHLYLMRELSEPTAEGAEPIGQLGCDLAFDSQALGDAPAAEFWTQDVKALADFVHQVESAEGFQALMNACPVETSLFREEV
jgi:hypothetical protein